MIPPGAEIGVDPEADPPAASMVEDGLTILGKFQPFPEADPSSPRVDRARLRRPSCCRSSPWPSPSSCMVLDQSAMNVSISTLVDDFDTTVTTIQAVITLYCLVMAMFMLTGGKIGDIIGRRTGVRHRPGHLRLWFGDDGGGADGGRPDPRLVDPRRARCRAGPAGDGGADRRATSRAPRARWPMP